MTDQTITRNFTLDVAQRGIDTSDVEQQKSNKNVVLEFPFSSEVPYLRAGGFDEPWVEILGHGANEVDLTRLNAGAPVLLNHGVSETADAPVRSVGVTQRAWIEKGRGYVEVKMSRREGMEPLLQDIADGIISNVSVGYQIHARELVRESKDSANEYRVTSWTPIEITLCDVPADATVGIGRSLSQPPTKEIPVDKEKEVVAPEVVAEETRSIAPAAQKVDVEAIKAIALAEERKRVSELKQMCRSVSIGDDIADSLIERGVSIEDARKEVLESLAKRTDRAQVSSRADIVTLVDETETRRELISDAIMYRANPSHKISDGSKQYAGMTMIDVCREMLDSKGVKTRGMDRMQIASRSFEGTSDLPSVLANVANKSLRQAYQAAPRTFTTWARQVTSPDFKQISRTQLSDTPALTLVNENGEFTRGVVSDGKETYSLLTVGKIVGITRQAIINDDLSAFTRIPASFATSAANYESDAVYAILTGTSTMSDGVALFNAASHFNLTSSGTAINVDSLSLARKLIRLQKTPKGVVMGLSPRYLIVPAALETVAWTVATPPLYPTLQDSANPFMGKLIPVVEARLDAASATAWYMTADPSQIDTVEYCYLEGQNGVYIETRAGFDVDGMEIKARLDFAAKAIDYRGLYKNVGG